MPKPPSTKTKPNGTAAPNPQRRPEALTRTRSGALLIYNMPAHKYHADPAKTPSLSASVASIIIAQSVRHAWQAHPRLNSRWKSRNPTDEMDAGSAGHTMLLGAGAKIERVGAKDWKAEWARDKRERVWLEGGIPILAHRIPEIYDCVEAAKVELQDNPEIADFFGPGRAEVVIIGPLGPRRTLCRTRIDWLLDDPDAWIYDAKFTSQSAAPDSWERHVWEDYSIQAEMICRLVGAVRGRRPRGVRLVVIETKPPFGVSIMTPGPAARERAKDHLDDAIARWATALETDIWPLYSRKVRDVDLPGWAMAKFEEERYRADPAAAQRMTEARYAIGRDDGREAAAASMRALDEFLDGKA